MASVRGMYVEVLDRFVALEGLDGAGTTTQLELVAQALRRLGLKCHPTREPTSGRYGQEIRSALRGQVRVHPLTLALLFAADRNEHLHDPEDGILAHLRSGETVITDRYVVSSLAYQSLDSGFEQVLALNTAFPAPRHLVFVDTPLEICQRRLRERGQRELFDEEGLQRKVQALYHRGLETLAQSGAHVHWVDGSHPPQEICEDIVAALGYPRRYS